MTVYVVNTCNPPTLKVSFFEGSKDVNDNMPKFVINTWDCVSSLQEAEWGARMYAEKIGATFIRSRDEAPENAKIFCINGYDYWFSWC